jgi:hypothetical protein
LLPLHLCLYGEDAISVAMPFGLIALGIMPVGAVISDFLSILKLIEI